MKRRTALILALIMILAVALSACGSSDPKPSKDAVTKDALIGSYRDRMENFKSCVYKIVMEMKIGVSALGQSQNIEMSGDLDVETTQEAAHVSGSVSANATGETQTTKVETYSIKNGDSYDIYTLSDGKWIRQTSSVNVKGDIQSILALHDPSNMEMKETDTEYVVTGTISLAEAFDALKSYMGGFDDLSGMGIDLSSLDLTNVEAAKTTYHFDKSTQEPTGVDIDMTDSVKSLMEQLVKALAGSLTSEGTSGIDLSSFIKINAEKLVISLKDIVFDKDIKIELPEAAKNASEVPSDDSGEYDSEMTDHYVEEMKISLPGAFQEDEVSGYSAAFYDNYTAVLVLREDKADLANYADNMEEYLQLVMKANESKGIQEPVYENGRPTFEYDAAANGVTYRYYTVAYESDEAYWLVQFACMKDIYEILKPLYETYADTVIFAH